VGFQPYSLSEDTICFFLAAGFELAGIPAHLIEMEVPHVALKKPKGMQKAVDVRVALESSSIWIEVKFDRKTAYGSQLNDTNRFGNLLKDLFRAGLHSADSAIVLYLTDKTMADYLQKHHSRLREKSVFVLETRLLDELPGSASRRVSTDVRAKLEGRAFRFQLFWEQEVGPLHCFAWETIRQVTGGAASPAP
jgi:hypothetical protein